jgi:hypothetical protein
VALPIEGKDKFVAMRSFWMGQSDVHQANRFLLAAPARTRNAGRRNTEIRTEAFAYSLGHGTGHGFGNSAVALQKTRGNP